MSLFKKLMQYAFMISLLMLCIQCEEDMGPGNSDNAKDNPGKLRVAMNKAAAHYESIFIDIQSIEINAQIDSTSGWKTVLQNPIRLDLLNMSNGVDSLLAELELEAGTYKQIRLILGTNNTVKVNGEEKELKTPSGQQSGIKLKMNSTIVDGLTYKISLDFDVARSIKVTGNSKSKNQKYNLKPVIRLITEATSSAVSGSVKPLSAASSVYLFAGTDTLTTYADTLSGDFLIKGVPIGTHSVTLYSRDEAYKDSTINSVVVNQGSITEIGEITLKQK